MSDLAPLLQGFFTERLMHQRQASPHTIRSYRDTFKLLLRFVYQTTGRHPAQLGLADLDAGTVTRFLQSLEVGRGNSPATRNARLAAIHSFFRYAALYMPDQAATIQQVLAVPPRRADRAMVNYLNSREAGALVAAPDRTTWLGRRDHALLLLALHTGLRVSELTALKIDDVKLGAGANVRCTGKGRKDRCTPLTKEAAKTLRSWISERGEGDAPVFPTRQGTRLSSDAVADLVAKHAATAVTACPSLATKSITPHTLRHSAAMALLRGGVDIAVIALWLGHESTDTTQIYLHADMSMKERALARMGPSGGGKLPRYKAPDALLAFLDGL
jgi:site-specific recombinase XerD